MYRLLCVLSASFIAFGCGSTSGPQPARYVPPSQIKGYIQLFEMDCSRASSFAGINVDILGTTKHAVTNDSGFWEFDSVPASKVYVLHFTKPGFSEQYIGAFMADTAVWNANKWWVDNLYRLPNWNVILGNPIIQKRAEYDYAFSFPSMTVYDSTGRKLDTFAAQCFVGLSPAIDYRNSQTIVGGGSNVHYSGITNNDVDAEIANHSLKTGDTLYIIGYAWAGCTDGNYEYDDGDSLKTGFCGFGPPSEVVKVVLP